jgi:uncharacterized protein YPO0396
VLQSHSDEMEQVKDLMAQQGRAAATRQGDLQRQLAEASTQVSSLTIDLKTAQQSNNNAVQVLLQI